MASSSLYRRLHGLFNHSRPSVPRFNDFNPSLHSSATEEPKISEKSTAARPLTAEKGLKSLVKQFLKKSESSLFRRRKGIYFYTVHRLADHKEYSMIEEIIEAQKKYGDIKNEGFAIRLIMLYGKAGMSSHARKLFDELPELNCERTVKSFNALLTSCVNSKDYDQVQTIFQEVPQEASIEANVMSYNIAINAYCEADALDKAILFFNTMEKNGMEPDLVTFNTLLTALYRKGRFLDGESIWDMMENKNIAPNLITYNARLQGMVLEKRIQEGIGLLAEMEEKNIKPDVYTFNVLIKGYCEDGDLEEAKKWYYKLKENEIAPKGLIYSTLLPFLCKHGDIDFGLQLCKEAIDNRLDINVGEVQRVVDGLVEVSKIEEAKNLVKLCNAKKYLNFKLELPEMST